MAGSDESDNDLPDEWQPDDTFHDIVDGEYKGVRRVKAVWEKYRNNLTGRIFHSREPLIKEMVEELQRDTLPTGFKQWQLPIVLGLNGDPVLGFITVGEPNAKIPRHRHEKDSLFRIVISGSVFFGDVELTAGDWMFVPKGKAYSLTAGPLGCVSNHYYNGLY